MSHLGHRLSALIDGELSAAERDRVHAHLASCAACRAEAKELRELKRNMGGLSDVPADDALTRRLVAIAEPGDPVPPLAGQAREATAAAGLPHVRRRRAACWSAAPLMAWDPRRRGGGRRARASAGRGPA
jgi:anti-sigma factor RsiW